MNKENNKYNAIIFAGLGLKLFYSFHKFFILDLIPFNEHYCLCSRRYKMLKEIEISLITLHKHFSYHNARHIIFMANYILPISSVHSYLLPCPSHHLTKKRYVRMHFIS